MSADVDGGMRPHPLDFADRRQFCERFVRQPAKPCKVAQFILALMGTVGLVQAVPICANAHGPDKASSFRGGITTGFQCRSLASEACRTSGQRRSSLSPARYTIRVPPLTCISAPV